MQAHALDAACQAPFPKDSQLHTLDQPGGSWEGAWPASLVLRPPILAAKASSAAGPNPVPTTALPIAPNRPKGELSPLVLDLSEVAGLEAGVSEVGFSGEVRPLPAITTGQVVQ